MRSLRIRRVSILALFVLAAGLLAFTGCDNNDDPTNPGGGTTGGGADIDVTTSTPASGNTNISGSSVVVSSSFENGGAWTRVQVDATSDGYLRQILVYFETATGNVQAVSYFWGVSSLLEEIVYCPAAGCSGVSVNTTTREIFFTNAPLDNNGTPGPGDPPTKFATLALGGIQYPSP